jgi:molybdopterin-binding protein
MKKLSARNQLKGKIIEVKKGTTTSHIRIDIGNRHYIRNHEPSGR